MSPNIPSPEEFFGHRMGADKKLARWDKIVEYFWELDKAPSVKVIELGLSTEGNPFLLAIISSSENIDENYLIIDDKRVALNLNTKQDYELLGTT